MTANKKVLCVAGGLLGGFINGLMGGGGGVVIVLLLTGLYRLSAKKAQATALLVILPLTVISAVVYIIGGADWGNVLSTSAGFTVGGAVGALLLNKLAFRCRTAHICAVADSGRYTYALFLNCVRVGKINVLRF